MAATEQTLQSQQIEAAAVSYAALTHIWATQAAAANQDWISVEARVAAVSSLVANFNADVIASLQAATDGLSFAVAQLSTQSTASKGAVSDAVVHAIDSTKACSSLAATQGTGFARRSAASLRTC